MILVVGVAGFCFIVGGNCKDYTVVARSSMYAFGLTLLAVAVLSAFYVMANLIGGGL